MEPCDKCNGEGIGRLVDCHNCSLKQGLVEPGVNKAERERREEWRRTAVPVKQLAEACGLLLFSD